MLQTPHILAELAKILNLDPRQQQCSTSEVAPMHSHINQPDIKYFRSIKEKNHFNYHFQKPTKRSNTSTQIQSKKRQLFSTSSEISHPHETNNSNTNNINPMDRNLLMKRISTFSIINWCIPELSSLPTTGQTLNELFCALSGWQCVLKNTLQCTSCFQRLKLKFHQLGDVSIPYDFDLNDIEELNMTLMEGYITQIQTTSHESNCLWKFYRIPAEGVYYHIANTEETNQLLILEYLMNAKELIENSLIIKNYKHLFQNNNSNLSALDLIRPDFITSTNNLLKEHFPENLENFEYGDSIVPHLYQIALLGWCLRVQSYIDRLILLIFCKECNSRVYLPDLPIQVEQCTSNHQHSVTLSSTQHLEPCMYRVNNGSQNKAISIYEQRNNNLNGDEDNDDENSKIDLIKSHKPWCSHLHKIDGRSEEKYIIEILTGQEQKNGIKRTNELIPEGRSNKMNKTAR